MRLPACRTLIFINWHIDLDQILAKNVKVYRSLDHPRTRISKLGRSTEVKDLSPHRQGVQGEASRPPKRCHGEPLIGRHPKSASGLIHPRNLPLKSKRYQPASPQIHRLVQRSQSSKSPSHCRLNAESTAPSLKQLPHSLRQKTATSRDSPQVDRF